MRVHATSRRGKFDVTADGDGMTGRAGTGLLAETADTLGLTAALSRLAGGCRSWAVHDPGKVLRDLIVMLADGGDALRHLRVLDGQRVLFGPVASPATANRTLAALAGQPDAVAVFDAARRAARLQAWRVGAAPPVVAAALAGEDCDEPLCIDLDATLITAHSDDKDGAGKTYKRTWGFHPWARGLTAVTDSGRRLPRRCGRATPERTPPRITSACSTPRSPSSSCPMRCGC